MNTFIHVQNFILASNWGATLAENWSDGAVGDNINAQPRGFPAEVPLKPKPPTLQWMGTGARSPRERRLAYERSRPQLTSLTANRRTVISFMFSIFSQFSVFKWFSKKNFIFSQFSVFKDKYFETDSIFHF